MGHADSEPFPSEETVHQFFEEVFLDIQKRNVGTPQKCCKMTFIKYILPVKDDEKGIDVKFGIICLQVDVDDGLVAVHCSHGLHRWEDPEFMIDKTIVKLDAI